MFFRPGLFSGDAGRVAIDQEAAMGWAHFGMTRRPFRAAADLAAYFPAESHEAARAELAAAHARADGLALLDGPPGVGKTLLATRWLADLPAGSPRVFLPQSHFAKPGDLLQAILFDLNQPYQGLGEQELRLAVTAELMKGLETGHTTTLVVDEAQQLSLAVLEELRQLGNIEGRGQKALFALLVAQPGLRVTLAKSAANGFVQRLAVRCGVDPLTPEESAGYVRHVARAAGGDPDAVFDEEAVSLLAGACRGVPRVLNQAAGLALDLAVRAEAEQVDAEAVLGALERLGLGADPQQTAGPAPPAPPARTVKLRPASSAPPPEPAEPPDPPGPKQRTARKRSA